jgi:GNAT superfamily N-acetyltransferase
LTAADRAAQQLALGRQYHGPDQHAPRALVVIEEDRVVAHASVFPREIGTTSGDMLIGGLARVCTDPAMRGRGLGEAVVRAAFRLVDEGVFPFLLFQTKPQVRSFYEKLGAVCVHNQIINSLGVDLSANPFWDEAVMRYPAHGDWPSGVIDLRGPGY